MKNNLDTPVAKQCRALYTKYAYGHTYGLLKVGLCCRVPVPLCLLKDQGLQYIYQIVYLTLLISDF